MIDSMNSPWHPNPLENQTSYMDEHTQSSIMSQFERSTSAPPRATQPGLPFGAPLAAESLTHNNDYQPRSLLFGADDPSESSLFGSSGRVSAPLSNTAQRSSSLILNLDGRSTAPSTGGLHTSTFLSEALRSSLPNNLGQSMRPASVGPDPYSETTATSLSPFVDGHLIRSQSAAPRQQQQQQSHFAPQQQPPLGPPPGLGGSREPSLGNSSILDSTSRDLLRRPASTGVIGEQTRSPSPFASPFEQPGAAAVRPAPRNVMDLIQEDRHSPLAPQQPYQRSDPYGGYTTTGATAGRGDVYGLPRETDRLTSLTHQVERLQVGPGQGYSTTRETGPHGAQYVTVSVPPQVQRHRGMPPQEARLQQQEMQQPRPLLVHSGVPHHQYEGQQMFFAGQAPPNSATPRTLEAPGFRTGGHTVYVNAPPYSYAVQYHTAPGHTQPTLVHHTGAPHDYAVLPLQGGQVAYWPQQEMPTAGGLPAGVQLVPRINPSHENTGSRRSRPLVETGTRSPTQRGGGGGGGGGAGGGGSRRTRGGGGGGGSGGGGAASSRTRDDSSSENPLLKQFLANKNRDWTMRDIQGHVVKFCEDQMGSRFIQQRLECGNAVEQRIVMKEVLPVVRQLRNNVFGNYVVQKLLEFGTPQMKEELRDTMKGEMLDLSLQVYGCRVVQKAMETLREDDLPGLLDEFHDKVRNCIYDQNGNHVVQKWIEVMSNKAKEAARNGNDSRAEFLGSQIDFIIDDVLSHVLELSCHTYGCRVLQRILEHCVESRKRQALDKISDCHQALLDDQFGNYVIQHVLQYGRHSDRESVMHIVIRQGILRMSQQKFASNVVEKLLKYGTPAQRNSLVKEMLKVDASSANAVTGEGTSVVLVMVRDQYANYVVQTTLDVVPEGEEKNMLLNELISHLPQLRNYTFAKHIVARLSS